MLETILFYVIQACTVAALGYAIMKTSTTQTAILGVASFCMLLIMDQVLFRYIVIPEPPIIEIDTTGQPGGQTRSYGQDGQTQQSGSGRKDKETSILYGQFGKPYEVPTSV
jgi:hypothetical protein